VAQLPELIRDAREASGMTQHQLGQALGVQNTSVSMWELGKVIPQPAHMIALVKILGLDAREADAAYMDAWRERESDPPAS
jgi:transcriptional regulator with XRE-family HTH domain